MEDEILQGIDDSKVSVDDFVVDLQRRGLVSRQESVDEYVSRLTGPDREPEPVPSIWDTLRKSFKSLQADILRDASKRRSSFAGGPSRDVTGVPYIRPEAERKELAGESAKASEAASMIPVHPDVRRAMEAASSLGEKGRRIGGGIGTAIGIGPAGANAGEEIERAVMVVREAAKGGPDAIAHLVAGSAFQSIPAVLMGTMGAAAGPGGIAVGTFLGTMSVEEQAAVGSYLMESGVDISDPDELFAALNDTELMSDINGRAFRRGVGVAAVEGLVALLGGKAIGDIPGVKGKLVALGTETAGEGAGEVGGQVAAGEEVSLGEAALESIAGAGQSVGTVAAQSIGGTDGPNDTDGGIQGPAEPGGPTGEDAVAADSPVVDTGEGVDESQTEGVQVGPENDTDAGDAVGVRDGGPDATEESGVRDDAIEGAGVESGVEGDGPEDQGTADAGRAVPDAELETELSDAEVDKKIGLSKARGARIRKETGLSELDAPTKRKVNDVLLDAHQVDNPIELARSVVKSRRVVEDYEQAALTIALSDAYDQHESKLKEAYKALDEDRDATKLLEQVDSLEDQIDVLTRAGDYAGTALARAFNMRKLAKERDTYKLSPVLARAAAVKKEKLTLEEKRVLTDEVAKLEEKNAELERTLEKERERSEQLAKEAAQKTLTKRPGRKPRARNSILAEMAKSGLNVQSDFVEVTRKFPPDVEAKMKRDGVDPSQVMGTVSGGKIYINPDFADRATEIVNHELAHIGLQGVFGEQINDVLDKVSSSKNEKLQAIADEVRKTYAAQTKGMSEVEANRLIAEEVIAKVAETDFQPSPVRNVYLKVKMLLKDLFGLDYSIDEIRAILARTRGYVERQGGPQRYMADAPVTVDSVMSEVESRWPGVILQLDQKSSAYDPYWHVSSIVVPKDQRGGGVGSKVMEYVVDQADRAGVVITLTPSTDFGATSVSRLRRFYSRFGFRRNTGRKANHAVTGAMIRDPQGQRYALAPPVESEAFKKWFGDSKVVDAQGKPLVVYHGTQSKMIDVFRPAREGDGIFFTSSADVAQSYSGKGKKARTEAVYLSFQDPLEIDANDGWWGDLSKANAGGWTVEQLFGYINSHTQKLPEKIRSIRDTNKEKGVPSWDSIIIRNVRDQGAKARKELPASDVYIALDPEQIKSATGNVGTYDPKNPDIRYALSNFESARDLIRELSFSYVDEGVTDLDEVVSKVQSVLPDVDTQEVWDAISGRGKVNPAKARTETQKRRASIKRQARVMSQLEDAEQGIFDPKRKRPLVPDEIKEMRRHIRELRKEFFQSEIEDARLNALVQKLDQLQDDFEAGVIHEKQTKKPDPERIAEVKKQINEIRQLMRLDATLTDLNEQLRTGNYKLPVQREVEVSKDVERARAQVAIAKKKVRQKIRDMERSTAGKVAAEAASFLRTMKATADHSGILRQGLWLSLTMPKKAAKFVAEAERAFFSEEHAYIIDGSIKGHDMYLQSVSDGLKYTEIDGGMDSKEERFQSNLASKLPVMGKVVQGSERHMVTYLNLLRQAAYNQFVEGHPDATQEQRKQYARFINATTGRGDLGRYDSVIQGLGGVFFAPRFAVSRFQAPILVAKSLHDGIKAGDYTVTKEIGKSAGAMVGTITTMLALTAIAFGDDDDVFVGTDPDSPDFGKIVIGGTRVDPWGGFIQPTRLVARIATGGQWTDNEVDPLNTFGQFLTYKMSPAVHLPLTLFTGKDAIGQETTPLDAAWKAITPIILESAIEGYVEGRGASTIGLSALGEFMGVGVATYDRSMTFNRGAKDWSPESRELFKQAGYAPSGASPSTKTLDTSDWKQREMNALDREFYKDLEARVNGDASLKKLEGDDLKEALSRHAAKVRASLRSK